METQQELYRLFCYNALCLGGMTAIVYGAIKLMTKPMDDEIALGRALQELEKRKINQIVVYYGNLAERERRLSQNITPPSPPQLPS